MNRKQIHKYPPILLILCPFVLRFFLSNYIIIGAHVIKFKITVAPHQSYVYERNREIHITLNVKVF